MEKAAPASSFALRSTLFARGTVSDGPLEPAEALAAAEEHGGWVWIDVRGEGPDAWKPLAAAVQMHHLALEDMQESSQRTKLEHYGPHTLLTAHPASYDDDAETVSLDEIDVYLGKRFFITHRRAGTSIPDDALARVTAAPLLAELGPRGAGYAVLDAIVDGYRPVMDGLEHDVDEIDDDLFSRTGDDVASRIYRLSRQVEQFHRAVAPLETVLEAARKSVAGTDPALLLGDGAAPRHPSDAAAPDQPDADQRRRHGLLEALLRDVLDHVMRIQTHTAELRSTLTNALNLAMTLASERATDIALQQSVQAKKISAWAAILASPAVLAGIWGMNFAYMPDLQLPWGYPAALGLMLAVCLGLYAVFKKKDWL